MSIDFNELAKIPMSELPEAPLVPMGTYRARCIKPANQRPNASGEWLMFEFFLELLEPYADVDPDQMEEFGPLNNVVKVHRLMYPLGSDHLAGAELTRNQKQAAQRIRRFLCDHLQIPDDMNTDEALASCNGYECAVNIVHELDSRDNETWQDNIKRTGPVAD